MRSLEIVREDQEAGFIPRDLFIDLATLRVAVIADVAAYLRDVAVAHDVFHGVVEADALGDLRALPALYLCTSPETQIRPIIAGRHRPDDAVYGVVFADDRPDLILPRGDDAGDVRRHQRYLGAFVRV